MIALGSTVFMVVALLAMLDPFYTGFDVFRVTRDIGPFKYAAVLVGLGLAGYSLMRIYLGASRNRRHALRAAFAGSLPLILFVIWVIASSLYARLFLGVDETFLQLGVGVLGYFYALLFYAATPHGLALAKRFMFWLMFAAMPFMFAWTVISYINGGQAFHSEVFLLVPLAIYAYLHFRRRWLAWPVILIVVSAGILSHKNTGYMVTLLVCVHLAILLLRRQRLSKGVLWFSVFALVLVVSFVIAFLLMNYEEYLPSGSTHVRFVTYLHAWNNFIGNPLLGIGFADSTLVYLDEGMKVLGNEHVIMHSDLLDILSHGGLLAMGLVITAVFGRISLGRKALAMRPDPESRALIHSFGSMVICGFVVAAFNAPWLSLTVALFYWFALGLLQSVATSVIDKHSAVSSVSRYTNKPT